MDVLLQVVANIKALSSKINAQTNKAFYASSVLTRAKDWVTKQGEKFSGDAVDAVDKFMDMPYNDEPAGEKVWEVMGGAAGGNVWSDGLADDAAYSTALTRWKKSGMLYTPVRGKAAVDKLEELVTKAMDLDTKLGFTANETQLGEAYEIVLRGKVTVYEGLLFYHVETHNANKTDGLGKTRSGIRKEHQKVSEAVDGMIHSCMKACKDKAMDLKWVHK